MDEVRITPAGDPFYAAALKSADEHPHACMDGWVFIGSIDEDGEEHETSYRCQRCAEQGEQ